MQNTLRLVAALSLCLTVITTQAERFVLVGASYGKNILAITDSSGEILWSHKTAGPERVTLATTMYTCYPMATFSFMIPGPLSRKSP